MTVTPQFQTFPKLNTPIFLPILLLSQSYRVSIISVPSPVAFPCEFVFTLSLPGVWYLYFNGHLFQCQESLLILTSPVFAVGGHLGWSIPCIPLPEFVPHKKSFHILVHTFPSHFLTVQNNYFCLTKLTKLGAKKQIHHCI